MHICILSDSLDFSEKHVWRFESEFDINEVVVNQGPDQIDTAHGVIFTSIKIIESRDNKLVNISVKVNILLSIKVH
jgi:hypothetical protein